MADAKTNWIWLKNWTAQDKEEPAFVLFRKEINVYGRPEKGTIRISADSRYKLYVNGKLAEAGPCKGDGQIWFADEVDLIPYLKKGKNVLAVRVLRYPTIQSKGCFGIYRTEFPGFFAEGKILDDEGKEYSLNAADGWKVRKDENFHIVSESDFFAPLQILENNRGALWQKGWMNPDYNEDGWEVPWEYPSMNQAVSPGNLQKRPIPFLFRKERDFENIVQTQDQIISKEEWTKFLKGEQDILVPPHSEVSVEISAGVERTAYLCLAVEHGKEAQISILQSEAYVLGGEKGALKVPVKDDREDYKKGFLAGFTDHYICAGFGTTESPEVYEPFWFRTFRFVRLEIKTKEEPLILKKFNYTETGYPLEVQTKAEASDDRFAKIWEISERTLRCCMHETYEDCPFYEQLQYAMDTRAQILYTYAVSADDRLARRCMEDFRRSQRYDGLLNCATPRYDASVIPGFSIYYILMLYDHMMYFGDRELLEDHMPTVERILQFFHRNRNPKGYVEKIGGLNDGKARFWSFIDWAVEWDRTTGIPPAILKGPVTMESLLYILGLQKAAKIAEYLDRKEQSRLFLERAEKVQDAVRTFCTGKNGMLQDGPGIEEYSQHTQVFSVLTDTVRGEQAKQNLRETILHKENYPQCSVAMAYYLFRALEKTDMYELTESYWDIWQRMIDKHATTCVEDEVQERSECHAWGALILYELPSVILGVRPSAPGYEKMEVRPVPGYLQSARGRVVTPKGMVEVEWYRENGSIHIKAKTSEGISEKEAEIPSAQERNI